MSLPALFDLLLAAMVVFVAWRAMTVPGRVPAVILFVAFGLLMALVWMRLRAPDVALAEAAIGAGLTGALFMATIARMPGPRGESHEP